MVLVLTFTKINCIVLDEVQIRPRNDRVARDGHWMILPSSDLSGSFKIVVPEEFKVWGLFLLLRMKGRGMEI